MQVERQRVLHYQLEAWTRGFPKEISRIISKEMSVWGDFKLMVQSAGERRTAE